jgi:hypothetical protein
MKFSIVLTTVNTVSFGLLLVLGSGGGGILPPALASPLLLPHDTKYNNEPANDVGPIELLGIMSAGGAAASASDFYLLGSEEPKDEVRISRI